MVSPPTYSKVHEWLMKSPDPPRQSRERTVASPKPVPKPVPESLSASSPEYTPPSDELVPRPSSVIRKDVQIKSKSTNVIDKFQNDSAANNDNNKHNLFLEILDIDEKIRIEGEDDDTETYTNCLPSTSTWEDAVILTMCTIHWLTVIALVCFLTGLIIVWKTGYRLGLRTHARRMTRNGLDGKD